MQRVRPRVVCLGNLFRDQLDRYGELEHIAERWRDAVAAPAREPRARRQRRRPARSRTLADGACGALAFGLDDPRLARPRLQHAADSKYCVRCGTPYAYAAAYVGHLGDYRCPALRPRAAAARRRGAGDRRCDGLDASAFDLDTPAGTARVQLPLPGLYNVYNALAAASLALALGAALDEIVGGSGALSRPRSAASSASRSATGGILLLLIKNPAGANEAVRTLVDGGAPRRSLVALNDEIADGRDVSWIWDVDFEPLLERARAHRRERRARGRARAALPYAGFDADAARGGARSASRRSTAGSS